VLHEGCSANNGTITLLRSITAKAIATKKRLLYQCHTTGGMDNATVAAFLIGAGSYRALVRFEEMNVLIK
jgi:hypothetical protein